MFEETRCCNFSRGPGEEIHGINVRTTSAGATADASSNATVISSGTHVNETSHSLVHPRTVFCTRGGLFTGVRVRDGLEPAPAGSSVALDVCCTTSVFVDGLGDFEDSCVQLGNGTIQSFQMMPTSQAVCH